MGCPMSRRICETWDSAAETWASPPLSFVGTDTIMAAYASRFRSVGITDLDI